MSLKNELLILKEGIRIFFDSRKNRKKYVGSSQEICKKIINDCFNSEKKYFMVSPYNFAQFYCRDFGMCCNSLLKLGYKKEVKETLIYALSVFEKHNKITTHITPNGVPVDFPRNGSESAAYLLHSLVLLSDKKLIARYKVFFEEVALFIFKNYVDKKTGLLRSDFYFPGMRDHAKRRSDCYNNCLLALFVSDLKKIGAKKEVLDNFDFDYKNIIKQKFWNGKYFKEDLFSDKFASDCNIFPFWTGLFDVKNKEDKKLFASVLREIKLRKLDEPFPLKYSTKKDSPRMNIGNLLVPGYETDSVWMHLGLCYLKVLERCDEELLRIYLKQFENLMVQNKNFLEVYDDEGRPFKRFLYSSDTGMLWCSIFLELKKKY